MLCDADFVALLPFPRFGMLALLGCQHATSSIQ